MAGPRVLFGDLGPIVRIGMAAVLNKEGIEVVGAAEHPQALLVMAERLHPDAVVLDVGQRDLAARVRATCPHATVVLWTRDEEVMEVVGPGASEIRRVRAPMPADLCAELALSRRSP